MIRLGNLTPKAFFLGNRPVRQIWYGQKKVWPDLPYDAEVQWLESTGAQWIETPIYISYSESFEVVCEGQIINNMRTVWVGDYQNKNYTHFNMEIGGTSHSHPYWTRAFCQTYATSWDKWISQRALNEVVTISITYNAATRAVTATDGTATQTGTLNAPSWPASNKPLAFFLDWRTNYRDAIQNPARLRRVTVNCGNTNCDFIAVRFTNENGVSEGAMYDKVTKQLFRNAGTGSFIIGPDKA